MTKQFLRAITLTVVAITAVQCNSPITRTVKLQANDPFKNTIVESKSFEIDSKQDNVVQGDHGTVVVCPKGCFLNAKGETVEENVKIELAEGLKLEDMVLSNLTTTSNGKLLETDGMIYFNATANGEQLSINKNNPVHIEIPTAERRPGMMAYKGVRDEKGNMNWVEPKEIDNFLLTVDINTLDFLPPGFREEVDQGMPYRNYKVATQGLTDSLYYGLSVSNGSVFYGELYPTDYNEPYYNKNKKVENGKYTDNSYSTETLRQQIGATEHETPKYDTSKADTKMGIDPAIIKVIKSKKYQNTLIATREFEARLKVIFETCDSTILEIYIKNLDKNLYELDSMAAVICEENKYYRCRHAFDDFAEQRLTKVRDADKYSELLKGYYEKEISNVKAGLEKQKEKAIEAINKKTEEAKKVVDEYKDLLWKREKYRMETYGFNWTETGWINIDNGTLPKSWGPAPLEITVENGKQFDRVYTYVIYESIKSLYRLNTTNNEQFYVGNDQEKEMLMPKHNGAVAIAIGYKDENPSLVIKTFETVSESKFSLTLSPSTSDKVKEAIRQYERYATENQISRDLEFMARFYEEKTAANRT